MLHNACNFGGWKVPVKVSGRLACFHFRCAPYDVYLVRHGKTTRFNNVTVRALMCIYGPTKHPEARLMREMCWGRIVARPFEHPSMTSLLSLRATLHRDQVLEEDERKEYRKSTFALLAHENPEHLHYAHWETYEVDLRHQYHYSPQFTPLYWLLEEASTNVVPFHLQLPPQLIQAVKPLTHHWQHWACLPFEVLDALH